MAEAVRVVKIKDGMPSADEARARLATEIDRARKAGVVALKIIHGYGSSGVGGTLRGAVRGVLRKRCTEGVIRAVVTGEQWSTADDAARELLTECPQLRKDSDLNRYNEGVTFVLL